MLLYISINNYYVLYLHLIVFCYLYYACFFLVISEIHVLFGLRMNENDVSLADCATTHTILRDKRLYSNKSRKNLLSFKDIRRNGYHIETMKIM